MTSDGSITAHTGTLPDGRTVAITLSRYGITARVAGRVVGTTGGLDLDPAPADAPPGVVARIGRLLLTEATADEIRAAIDAYLRDRPDVAAEIEQRRLRAERVWLVDAVRAARAAWQSARNAAMDADDTGPRATFGEHLASGQGADQEREVEAARRALDEFDRDHPEILAEIKVEAAEAVERRMLD